MKNRIQIRGPTWARAVGLLVLTGLSWLAFTTCGGGGGGTGPGPTLVLSSKTVDWTPSPTAPPPTAQVQITHTGSAELTGLAVAVEYASGSGWLSATLSSTTTPSTLTLTATPPTTAGSYTATATVSATGVASQAVTVHLTIGAPPGVPVIHLSPTIVSFEGMENAAASPDQTIAISNTGTGSLTGLTRSVSYQSGTGWLTATLSSPAAPAAVLLHATTGSLVEGTYSATVSVASPAANNSPQTAVVNFVVMTSRGPTLSALDAASCPLAICLTWTYKWPTLTGNGDHYLLEESPNGASFAQIAVLDRASTGIALPRQVFIPYWYRVRVGNVYGLTEYSNVVQGMAGPPPGP
jgi:hypothetical protein